MTITWDPIDGQDVGTDTVTSPAPTPPLYSLPSVTQTFPANEAGRFTKSDDGLAHRGGVRLDHDRTVSTWTYINCPPRVGEVQTVTEGGSGLTSFTLTFAGQTTGSIAAAATGATVQTALEALSTLGVGDVTVTGSANGPYTVTFGGLLAGYDVAQMTATPTGGTGTVTVTTMTAGSVSRKPLDTEPESLVFWPFTFGRSLSCGGLSPFDVALASRLVREDLLAASAWEISRQFQTGAVNAGTVTESPSLQTVGEAVGPGTAVPILDGIAILEHAYHEANRAGGGNTSGPPLLHIPYIALSRAGSTYAVTRTAGGLVGPAGEAVSVGPGYDPSLGPGTAEADDGEAWIWITGPVYLSQGDPFDPANPRGAAGVVEGHHTPRTNVDAVIAERRALFAFDAAAVFGVLVEVPEIT